MSGTHFFKTNRQDPASTELYPPADLPANTPASLGPNFYGGRYMFSNLSPDTTVDKYVQVITEAGVKTLCLKLDSLGGTGPDQYILQNNIDAFEAAYLTPLKIVRTATATLPQNSVKNTLHIAYQYNNDDYTPTDEADTFVVKIKTINTYDRLVNVARVVRAILNGKRDNSFITAMIMLALLRDDDDHKFSNQSFPVAANFTGPTTSPLNGLLGPVVPINATTNRDPHVAFTWPFDTIDPTLSSATSLGTTYLQEIVRERLLNTTGLDVNNLSWITFHAYPDAVTPQQSYLGVEFEINDDPERATLAVGIIDQLRAGMLSYIDFLRGVWRNNTALPAITDLDPNLQRGVFAHLDDTLQARDEAPTGGTATYGLPHGSVAVIADPTEGGGLQYQLWEDRGW